MTERWFMLIEIDEPKKEFRRLWTQRINAAARLNGTTYSKLIGA